METTQTTRKAADIAVGTIVYTGRYTPAMPVLKIRRTTSYVWLYISEDGRALLFRPGQDVRIMA